MKSGLDRHSRVVRKVGLSRNLPVPGFCSDYDTPEGILFLADSRVVICDRELGWLYLAVAAILLDLQDRRNRLLCAVTLSHRLGLDPVRYVSK